MKIVLNIQEAYELLMPVVAKKFNVVISGGNFHNDPDKKQATITFYTAEKSTPVPEPVEGDRKIEPEL